MSHRDPAAAEIARHRRQRPRLVAGGECTALVCAQISQEEIERDLAQRVAAGEEVLPCAPVAGGADPRVCRFCVEWDGHCIHLPAARAE